MQTTKLLTNVLGINLSLVTSIWNSTNFHPQTYYGFTYHLLFPESLSALAIKFNFRMKHIVQI